jgi:TonB family protein
MLLAAYAACAGAIAAEQVAEPARGLERSEPTFPLAARQSGVEGDVPFRATIDASGRLERVDIESVPQPDLGFEEATRAAVSRWRFAPAVLRGLPTASEYKGTLRFTLTLPGEAMLSAPSRETWEAARAMVRDLKIPVEKADDRSQLVTSGPVRYIALKLPDASSLGLPRGFRPDRLTLHVYVTPGMQPARVAVGSVMDIESIAQNDLRRFRVYGHEAVARWFLAELAQRMGVRMEAMAASAERRASQSQALMPPGLNDPCSTATAQLVNTSNAGGARSANGATLPKLIHEEKPTYPKDQLEARKVANIVFHGEITEHGTLVHPTMTEPADAPVSFVESAQLAFGLWRFNPGQAQGCPVGTNAVFESSFKLRN